MGGKVGECEGEVGGEPLIAIPLDPVFFTTAHSLTSGLSQLVGVVAALRHLF